MDDGALAGLAGLRALPGEAGRVLHQWPARQPLAGAEGTAGGSQGQVLLVASAGKQGGTFTAISALMPPPHLEITLFFVHYWLVFVFILNPY